MGNKRKNKKKCKKHEREERCYKKCTVICIPNKDTSPAIQEPIIIEDPIPPPGDFPSGTGQIGRTKVGEVTSRYEGPISNGSFITSYTQWTGIAEVGRDNFIRVKVPGRYEVDWSASIRSSIAGQRIIWELILNGKIIDTFSYDAYEPDITTTSIGRTTVYFGNTFDSLGLRIRYAEFPSLPGMPFEQVRLINTPQLGSSNIKFFQYFQIPNIPNNSGFPRIPVILG